MKSELLKIRLTAAEKQNLLQRAEAASTSLSALVRAALFDQSVRPAEPQVRSEPQITDEPPDEHRAWVDQETRRLSAQLPTPTARRQAEKTWRERNP